MDKTVAQVAAKYDQELAECCDLIKTMPQLSARRHRQGRGRANLRIATNDSGNCIEMCQLSRNLICESQEVWQPGRSPIVFPAKL